MNWLDRAIGAVFPRWGYSRASYREAMRTYAAADTGRLRGNWIPVGVDNPESIDGPDRDIIRRRAQQLERDSDIAEAVIAALDRNVIGTGITPQARVRKADGTLDDVLNKEIEKHWKVWAKKYCDITGYGTFSDLEHLMLRRMVFDGESIVHPVSDMSGPYPLMLQVLEAANLDASHDTSGFTKNRCIQGGVEVNQFYRPTKYYFTTLDSTQTTWNLPANQVIHLFGKRHPQQTRGVSPLANVMSRIKDTDEFNDAELIAAKVSACFAAFITRKDSPLPRITTATDGTGQRRKTMEPGMMEMLGPGESVEFGNPSRPNANAGNFTELQMRRVSSGQGLSYEAVSRDLGNVNYSSARIGGEEDKSSYKIMQQFFVAHLCEPIWEKFIESLWMKGLVKMPNFADDRQRYMEVGWQTPGWAYVNPQQEANADSQRLEDGTTTRTRICAAQGLDYEELSEERAREERLREKLGLNKSTEGGEGGGDNQT
jgi:lambda family phage portal protein